MKTKCITFSMFSLAKLEFSFQHFNNNRDAGCVIHDPSSRQAICVSFK